MTFESFQHPPPAFWEEFEDLCHTLYAEIWKDPTAQKNGRRGEVQHGVDIWGRLPNGDWVAVQCKGKDNYADKAVTAAELRREVEKALGFDRKLARWTLATSGPKRGDVEALARKITVEHEAKGLFAVQVMGWDDLPPLIGSYEKVVEKHFPDFAPRTRRMADRIDDIHALLLDPDRIGQPASPMQLLPGAEPPSVQEEGFTPPEAQRVRDIFGAKSTTLLRWPRTIAGRWLDRPELASMLDHLARPKASPLVLLGPPGSGKSALMARLGEELVLSGHTLLAIKADMVPREVTSLADLQAEFEAPEPLDECLARLSAAGPVALLIDQLDALADLMDEHGGRLGALLALVALVRNRENLSVILSSRDFEFRNDARLTALDAGPVPLVAPSWDAVREILEERGLQPGGWLPEFQEVLRMPQHLDLFLRHLADRGGAPAYASYHDMLDDVFRRRILSNPGHPEDGEALHAVARAMVEEEDLWLPAARFDTHSAAIRRLEASGFLIRDGARVGFRHQTVFDFVRARAFVAGGESVADYAIGRQGTIFARPTVWSALTYLRESDPAAYERDLSRLWSSDLRPHMRGLLRDFIGQQAAPSEKEVRLLLPSLADEGTAVRTLRAMTGSPGWFDRLLSRLPGLMRSPDPVGWSCAAFLRSVMAARDDAILALAASHWSEAEHAKRVGLVLDGIRAWSDAAADLAEGVAGDLDNWTVMQMAKSMSSSVLHRVPALLLRRLEAILATSRAQPDPERALEHFLRDPAGFYGLDALLAKAPGQYVRTLWPWYATVAAETASVSGRRGAYRPDGGALLDRYGHRHGTDDHPGPALCRAVEAWAKDDPDAFLAFAREAASTDLGALHQFLARGYQAAAGSRPSEALAYLIGDHRRFFLGTYEDERVVTKDLIAAVAAHLGKEDVERLAAVIRGLPSHWRPLSRYKAEDRLAVLRCIRQERLDLLRAIPEAARPRRLARRIEKELLEVGEPWRRGPMNIRGGDAGMTVADMAAVKDEEILGLLGWQSSMGEEDHLLSTDYLRSSDAARVFGEFAKEHPERTLRLMRRMQSVDFERPVSHALSTLSEKGALPASEIIDLVVDLDGQGFTSREFRQTAGFALARSASSPDGLADDVCSMLAGWLGDYEPPEKAGNRLGRTEKEEDRLHPLLWGLGGIRFLPGGNYPILRALEMGWMLRQPPAADVWLTALEAHLGRHENPEVWATLADDLRFLWHANRARTVAFFGKLFDEQPSVANGLPGLLLLAWCHRWLPDDFVHSLLRRWLKGDWDRSRQTAGEFAALRTLLVPEDAVVAALLEEHLASPLNGGQTSDFLFGVACTMANTWNDAACRLRATEWIERLAAVCDWKLAAGLRPIFHVAQDRSWDIYTERVLRACLGRPALLTVDTYFLPKVLKDVLRDGMDPVLVGSVALGMIRSADSMTQAAGGGWITAVSDFFEIATALQRIAETRLLGIELFEELLAVDVHGISEQVDRFDRNRFA